MTRRLPALLLLPAAVAVASGHVGDNNTHFRGEAGPYTIQVVVRHPGVVPGLADDRRDPLQAGLLGRPPPALAHDELVAVLTDGAHDDRLEQADLLDRVHELGHRLLLEHLAGLAGVRGDRGDGQLGKVRTLHRRQLRLL